MARRKNVKRIDPRYFLNETVNRLEERDGESAEEVAMRFKSMPIPMLVQAAVQDMRNMADGSTEMASHYPHVQDLAAFAQEVLELMGAPLEEGWKELAQGAKDLGRDVTSGRALGKSAQIRKGAAEARRLDAEEEAADLAREKTRKQRAAAEKKARISADNDAMSRGADRMRTGWTDDDETAAQSRRDPDRDARRKRERDRRHSGFGSDHYVEQKQTMAHYKKNVKRIDPRYFLNETVNRLDDGSAPPEDSLDEQGTPPRQFDPEVLRNLGMTEWTPSFEDVTSASKWNPGQASANSRVLFAVADPTPSSEKNHMNSYWVLPNARVSDLESLGWEEGNIRIPWRSMAVVEVAALEEELEEGLFPKGSVASWGEKWVTDKAKSAGSAIAGAFKGKEEEPPPPDPDSDEGKVAAVWGPIAKKLYYFKPSPGRPMEVYKYFYGERRAEAKSKRISWGPEQFQMLALRDLKDWAKQEERQAMQRDPERKAQIAAKYEKEDAERAEEKRRRDGGRKKKYRPRRPSASQIANAAMTGRWGRESEE